MNWMTLQSLIVSFLLMSVLPATALLTSRRTRPEIFFSFTVDPSLRQSAAGQAILRRFSLTVILSAILGLVLTLSGVFGGLSPRMDVALILVGATVEFVGIIAAYAAARRQVRPHRVEPSREREVLLRARPTRPVGGWLGQAGPFLILGGGAFCLWRRWDAIPRRIPTHWNLYGSPDQWADKSGRSVFGSVLLGALVCLVLSLLLNGLVRGVRRIHSSGLDGAKESRFLGTMLLFLLGLEYCLAGIFGFAPILPARLTSFLFMAIGLVVVGMLAVAIWMGQGGWRLRGQIVSAPGHQAPDGDRTPDECWKWGLFYYNPADPVLWVEKRFGIGWTINFGNPRAWFILGATLLLAVATPVLSILLFK